MLVANHYENSIAKRGFTRNRHELQLAKNSIETTGRKLGAAAVDEVHGANTH